MEMQLLLSDILGTDEDVVGKDMETDVERKLLKTAIEKLIRKGTDDHRTEVRTELLTGRRRHRKRWQICLESPSPISQDLRKKLWED